MPLKRSLRTRDQNFFAGLLTKLGMSLFGLACGGVLNQYMEKSLSGMLVFTALLVISIIAAAVDVAAQDR